MERELLALREGGVTLQFAMQDAAGLGVTVIREVAASAVVRTYEATRSGERNTLATGTDLVQVLSSATL